MIVGCGNEEPRKEKQKIKKKKKKKEKKKRKEELWKWWSVRREKTMT
jgi:hypothetical protein